MMVLHVPLTFLLMAFIVVLMMSDSFNCIVVMVGHKAVPKDRCHSNQ